MLNLYYWYILYRVYIVSGIYIKASLLLISIYESWNKL
jgi:hypothetical protein